MTVREIDTPHGMARAHLLRPSAPPASRASAPSASRASAPLAGPSVPVAPRGSVVLGHGAGGGIEAPDVDLLTSLVEDGWTVVRVEQPWRVAGKKVATAPPTLDAAWLVVLETLTRGRWALPRPLVCGGRSAGARVACRTAEQVGADAVLALSFPLHPPGKPEKSRAAEGALVTQAGRPLAVVQGQQDPFGTPEEVRAALGSAASIYTANGNHGFSKRPVDVLEHARTWLACR